MAVSAAQVSGNGIINTENLNRELKANFNSNETVKEFSNFYTYTTNKIYRIYNNGQVERRKLLVEDYQQLEYIEGTGKQYINTHIPIALVSSSQTNFSLTFSITDVNSTFILCGSNINWKQIVVSNGAIRYDWISKGNYNQKFPLIMEQNKIYNITQKNNVFWFDNYSTNILSTSSSNYNFGLFGKLKENNTVEASTQAKMKLYEFIIENNNNLIHDFIPCKSTTTVINADDEPVPSDTKGLYDLVEGKFYTNQGTGVDFTPGPEV